MQERTVVCEGKLSRDEQCGVNDSDWPKIFPEGTLLEDGYGCVYKVKNEKVERIWVPSSRALARIFG